MRWLGRDRLPGDPVTDLPAPASLGARRCRGVFLLALSS